MMVADILDVLAKLNLRLVEGGSENPARKAYLEYCRSPEMVELMKDVRESMGHYPERN